IVKSKLVALGASTLLALGATLMSTGVSAADAETDLHTRDSDTDIDTQDLDRRLADARARLEQAAHEVAELSSQLGGPLMDKFMVFNDEYPSRAVIGVQLDPTSGKDGARIQEVSPGGPAQEAGLRVGDVITQINGTDIKGERTTRQV